MIERREGPGGADPRRPVCWGLEASALSELGSEKIPAGLRVTDSRPATGSGSSRRWRPGTTGSRHRPPGWPGHRRRRPPRDWSSHLGRDPDRLHGLDDVPTVVDRGDELELAQGLTVSSHPVRQATLHVVTQMWMGGESGFIRGSEHPEL